ncbi:transcription initiation factor TFIID subunit 4-like isoform X1 [Haliotis cracherodii]|uniref:transcription initiation factor TFIID subunit 4-like isoform X1 n=1 Tax=Haliotis cracherodii TaxID=6455 RepID=UPI0039EB6822
MADPGSIDDLLSSEIDETAVSALVGSLESQLASPTNKEPPKTISDASVNNNHIGTSSTNVTSTNPSFVANSTTSAGQKGLPIHNNTALNASFGPTSKSNLSENQILGIASIINSSPVPATTGGVSLLNVNTVNSKAANPSHIRIITQPQNNAINPTNTTVVHIPASNTGSFMNSIGNSNVNSITTSVHGTSGLSATRDNSAASNAIYNLATIAAEQKPISVAQNGSPHQQTVQNIHRGKDSSVSSSQPFLMKQEPGNGAVKQENNPNSPYIIKQEVKQESMNMQTIHLNVPGTHSDSSMLPGGAHLSGAGGNMHNVSISNIKGNASPSVITVRTQPPPHQHVTVVRPSVVSTQGTSGGPVQIVNVNASGTRTTGMSKGGQRMSNPIRIAAQQPQQISIAPRQQSANTITLQPGGFQLQPGTLLVKNEQGQLMLMSTTGQGAVPGSQSIVTTVPTSANKLQNVRPISTQGRSGTVQTYVTIQPPVGQGRGQPTVLQQTGATMPVVNTHLPSTAPNTVQVPGSIGQPQAAVAGAGAAAQGVAPHGPASQPMENVKKCKNFLSTLIKLASSQPPQTVRNVRELIQGLIDDRVQPEMFTARLQEELKSSPQPYLIPFLKKSLPLLRQCLISNKMTIEGVTAPKLKAMQQHVPAVQVQQAIQPNLPVQHLQHQASNTLGYGGGTPQSPNVQFRLSNKGPPLHALPQPVQSLVRNKQGYTSSAPGAMPTTVSALQAHMGASKSEPSHKEKRKFESLKDDDDINDVATMGGVNLTEESKNILATNAEFIGTQIRSCKDETFLYHGPLLSRIHAIAKKHGVEEIASDVVNIISHATQERLRNMVERLSTIAEHRIEIYKMDPRYEVTKDIKTQLNFLQELDKLEKKRHEEQEREILLRAIKSRSKNEDPEQMKLKQKAKEFQLQEIEAMRQKEANQTALLAIGPRKKRKTESADQGQGAGSSSSSLSNGLGSSSVRPSMSRPRIKRVNLRDLMFLLEQERSSTKSNILYKAFLK